MRRTIFYNFPSLAPPNVGHIFFTVIWPGCANEKLTIPPLPFNYIFRYILTTLLAEYLKCRCSSSRNPLV